MAAPSRFEREPQQSKCCVLYHYTMGAISKQVLTVAQRVELLAARVELAYLRDNRYPLMELLPGYAPSFEDYKSTVLLIKLQKRKL